MIDSTKPILTARSHFAAITDDAVAAADFTARSILRQASQEDCGGLIYTELEVHPDGTFAVAARWVAPIQESRRDKVIRRIDEALRHDNDACEAIGWAQLIREMDAAGIR